MFTATTSSARPKRLALSAIALSAVLGIAGCSQSNPLEPRPGATGDGETIVVGSQAYYSNEIIAELYAQVLENAGFTVERRYQIGQRDAYWPALENGEVDVFPEYTGNLLQFLDPDSSGTDPDTVYQQLTDALPDGLTALDRADAQDADSYNVTQEFSDEHDVTSLADLAGVDVPIILGGNPELAERPYGPDGLLETYGVEVSFTAIGDSGGPLTKAALESGEITMGDVYSADPDIATSGFVTLDDPEGLFLAQNVVPIVSQDLADQIADLLNEVNALLTTDELIRLNGLSTTEQQSSKQIAEDWLRDNNLID
ncbi:ABC transporter substrate-binding protein [Cryobacterium sp. BB307]|uniref:ABC transporter substrate-binding protein n=1 Tax=Cryobacterium sp. BB307 TaxID=2716317 RepID=UPI001447E798|nr:ABC transporter substrate-binding protein [Cryobacterium sp. BB307]